MWLRTLQSSTSFPLLLIFWTAAWSGTSVLANTEIVNFAASNAEEVLFEDAKRHTEYHDNVLACGALPVGFHSNVLHCQLGPAQETAISISTNDLLVSLELDDSAWSQFSAFSFRISWAASCPIGVSVQIFSPPELRRHFALPSRVNGPSTSNGMHVIPDRGQTRRKYAYVRLLSDDSEHHDTDGKTPTKAFAFAEPIPLTLLLEPLHVGFLPASTNQVLFVVIAILPMAVFLVPRILSYLEGLAHRAVQESIMDGHKETKVN